MKAITIALSLIALTEARAENFSRFVHTISDLPGVQRTYDSRSLKRGVFGFGWCSDLDVSLDATLNGMWRLLTCEGAESVPSRAVQVDGGNRVVRRPNGSLLRFDGEGRLRSLSLKGGPRLELMYDKEDRIVRIERSGIWALLYFYNGDLLKRVKTATGLETQYTYDTVNNLIRIEFPSGEAENLLYRQDEDLLMQRRTRNGLLLNYDPQGRVTRVESVSLGKISLRYENDGTVGIQGVRNGKDLRLWTRQIAALTQEGS